MSLVHIEGCDDYYEDVYEALEDTTVPLVSGMIMEVREIEIVNSYKIRILDPEELTYEEIGNESSN